MEIPIFRAVPSTILIALLIFVVFKSGNFVCAISSNWAFVTDPTVILLGVDDPFFIDVSHLSVVSHRRPLSISCKPFYL